MAFSMIEYLARLKSGLRKLEPRYRAAFAAWCADALPRSYDFLSRILGTDRAEVLTKCQAYTWAYALSGVKGSKSEMRRLHEQCENLQWADDDFADAEQMENLVANEVVNGIIGALDTCEAGSIESAAKAAECVIDKLNIEIDDELVGTSAEREVFSDPRMTAELERQKRMLAFLKECPELSHEHKTLFKD